MNINHINTYLLFFALLCCSSFSKGQITLERNVSMDMEGLYFWYPDPQAPVFLFNRNITPKADCFDIVNGYAFLTWYKGGMENRNLMVSRTKLESNKWVTVEFPEKNTLYTDVYQGIDYKNSPGGDSHRTTSLGISAKDGTIHMVFDQHTGALNYRVSKKNIAFGPDSMFVLENFLPKRDYFKNGQPITSCTYPNFITNAAGELILNFRIGTARQGDMTGLYYDGETWSTKYTIVKGNNVPQQFNTYGNLYYFNNHLYLCGSLRVYGSITEVNQGIYFAKSTGQHGNERWQNMAGISYSIPMSNLLAPLKIAEPLPTPTDRMTSSATMVVSEDGSYHFSAQVSGNGIFHYYKTPDSETLIKSTSSSQVDFAAGDRVYGVRTVASTGRLVISSTQQNESNWRDDLSYRPQVKFANTVSKYYDGKLYMLASEYKESDTHSFRFLTFDLGIVKPMIKFEIPKTDTTITEGHKLKIKVKASNPEDTIVNVKLYMGEELLSQMDEAPYEWGYSEEQPKLNDLKAGEYTISALATNSSGKTEEIVFTLTVLEDLTKNKRIPCAALASTTEGGHSAEQAMDGNYNADSYWSGRGKGASIVFDLCGDFNIQRLGINWLYGDRWIYDFEIEVSTDSINWTPVFSGKSVGQNDETQLFPIDPREGRYVRYIGNGNSANSLNSIIELNVYGELPDLIQGMKAENSGIKVFPNPASSEVRIEWKGNETLDICLIDMLGNLVLRKENVNSGLKLSKHIDLKKGTYLIVLKKDQFVLGKEKLVII